MKSTYKELRERAWNALEGHWWEAACMVLVIGACELVIEAISGNPMENSYRSIVQILALGLLPMSYAFETSILRLVRTGESLKVNELFTVYRDNFGNSFLIKLFVGIFVLLWACLFIVPGIVMSYAYSMSVYILNDNPDMTPMQAIKASKEMMRGAVIISDFWLPRPDRHMHPDAAYGHRQAFCTGRPQGVLTDSFPAALSFSAGCRRAGMRQDT